MLLKVRDSNNHRSNKRLILRLSNLDMDTRFQENNPSLLNKVDFCLKYTRFENISIVINGDKFQIEDVKYILD